MPFGAVRPRDGQMHDLGHPGCPPGCKECVIIDAIEEDIGLKTAHLFSLDPPDPHRRHAIIFPTPTTVTPHVTFPAPRSFIGLRGLLTPSRVRSDLSGCGRFLKHSRWVEGGGMVAEGERIFRIGGCCGGCGARAFFSEGPALSFCRRCGVQSGDTWKNMVRCRKE